ncbi:hypothetical protein Tco_1317236 [Tanacetum coccineum]
MYQFSNDSYRDTVKSSEEASSGVTYTSISSDYEEPSNVGSPGVVVYGYDCLPMHPEVPIEDRPYVAADSPIALYPGCIADSDPEEDQEDESEDGPTDYLADGRDDDNDDSLEDDADDWDKEEASKEEEEKEEEEHLA